MTIVDTTVWIDYLGGTANPHTDWLDRGLNRQRLGLTDLIAGDFERNPRESTFTRARRDLSKFEVFDTGGEPLAVASAQNYRFLRSRGHTVRKTIDCLIATFCLTEQHSLLHRDRDFDSFEKYLGLRVLHP